MEDAFVFYAYWNGNQVRDLFEGLVALTNAEGFTQLAVFLVTTGLVGALLVGSVKGEGRHVISYFACAVLFWFVAIVPKATVVIEDVRSHTVYTVDNVPLSMAFFASASSRIGHWMTQTYETAFVPVDVAKYSSFGAVYPQRVLDVLQRTGPVTVQGRETLQAVLKNCVLPEVVLDSAKASQLTTSSDLWETMKNAGWVNPARMAVMPDGSVKKCPDAVAALDQVLVTVELPALQKWVGLQLGADAASPAASITAAITQTESLLLNISRSAESSLKHSLILTTLPKVMTEHAANSAGPAAMASVLARSQGNLAGEINYRTMAKIAEDALPKIRNALEFVVMAMFPVVALIALVSGTAMGNVVRSYITLLLTIQLWPALSSVVNYLVITHDQHPFTLLAANFGAASLQAATLIRETGASSQAIAGMLLCAVPVISYALVRAGDVAVGQLVGGLMQPAQGAATSQGAALASGNVSQGNVSVNNVSTHNVSGNKMDASVRAVDSGMGVTASAFGSVTQDGSGRVTGVQRTPIDLGVSSQTQQQFVRGHQAGYMNQTSVATNDAANFSFTQSATSSDSTQQQFSRAFRNELQTRMALDTNRSDSSGWGNSVTITQGREMARIDQVSEGTAYRSEAGLNIARQRIGDIPSRATRSDIGGETGFVSPSGGSNSYVRMSAQTNAFVRPQDTQQGFIGKISEAFLDPFISDKYSNLGGVGGKLQSGLSFDDAQKLVDSVTGKTTSQDGRSLTQDFHLVRSAAESVANSHADANVRSYASQFVRSLGEVHSVGRTLTTSNVHSETGSSSLTQSDTGGTTVSADNGVQVMEFAIDRYGSAQAALRSTYESGQSASMASDFHYERMRGVEAGEAFGPGSMSSPIARQEQVFEEASKTVEMADHSNRARYETVAGGILDGDVARMAREQTPSVAAQSFDADYQGFVREHQSGKDANERRMNFDRGVILLSKEAYSMENDDKNFALRNTFLGAWGYRSGDQIQDDLRSWASGNPVLQEQIEKIGAGNSDSVSSEVWENLVSIARQPKGLRP